MSISFPFELERHIFEIAAHLHPKSIPTLFLVAHRVKTWLEPVLYNVVVFANALPGSVCFDYAQFCSAIQSQTTSEYVTNLLISDTGIVDVDDVHLILASCSAVENLVVVPSHTTYLPFLAAMPLRRLYISLIETFPPARAIDFTHSLFSYLTHLLLSDRLEDTQWEDWQGLVLIPNLTHLAFLVERSLPIFQGALTGCPKLRVLVSLYWQFHTSSVPEHGLEPLGQDTRFVCMPAPRFSHDWQVGARGGEDFWVRAEDFVAQRVSERGNRGSFVLRESVY
ncbi:hypothetical protein R3P38DRAFT_2889145 [Favolaschia claudopus]|uniref:F-box domain-containing protein n=1 Tax=Favolaschia claudopus TaxID=2862362 RepID=A0AAW0CUL5_9AGAR